MEEELATVATFQFASEAELAKLHLREEGIPAFLADAQTVNMDWFLGNALGYIKLQVPRSKAEAAAALLARHPSSHVTEENDETDVDEESVCLACGTPMPDEQSTCPSCGWSFDEQVEA